MLAFQRGERKKGEVVSNRGLRHGFICGACACCESGRGVPVMRTVPYAVCCLFSSNHTKLGFIVDLSDVALSAHSPFLSPCWRAAAQGFSHTTRCAIWVETSWPCGPVNQNKDFFSDWTYSSVSSVSGSWLVAYRTDKYTAHLWGASQRWSSSSER